ncbi:MAG: family 43 glycosylhydrolase [Brachybacterium sp.]|nr:family 43 glycosylhydrolase [Brachybacterium sp.]
MTITIRPGSKMPLLDASPSHDRPWYINDHTLIVGPDGRWHVFGIWHPEPAAPLDETFFLHASSPSLIGEEWTIHDPVMHARPDQGVTHVWAPHIIKHAGTYWMFYCGGTPDHERYRIDLATSEDLHTWHHHPASPLVIDGYDARDPMVLQHDGQWLLYCTRTSTPAGGYHEVSVRRSDDLLTWSDPEIAYRSTQRGTVGGPTESPFVIEVEGTFLLFVCESGEYDRTLVYASEDPCSFDDDGQIDVDLDEHCAEIVRDGEDLWITGGGWGRGGLSIRPLEITAD